MDENIKILNRIYRNSRIGSETIKDLLPYIHGSALKRLLKKQRRGYRSLNRKAKKYLVREKRRPCNVGKMTRSMIKNSIACNLLMDGSSSHIAGMMAEGSIMGVTQAINTLNKAKSVSKKVKNLAKDTVKFEQRNIEHIEPYL